MDLGTSISIVGGVTVAGVSYVVARLNAAKQKDVDEGNLALGLVRSLQEELERQQRAHNRELDSMRQQHNAEIAELRNRMESLQRTVDSLTMENLELRRKVGGVGGH